MTFVTLSACFFWPDVAELLMHGHQLEEEAQEKGNFIKGVLVALQSEETNQFEVFSLI
jgi:hypothetical protein